MHSGMVKNARVQRGCVKHTDFTQDEQRELWLLPWVVADRKLRNATREEAPPPPGTVYEAVGELAYQMCGKRGRLPEPDEAAEKRLKAAFPQAPAKFRAAPILAD